MSPAYDASCGHYYCPECGAFGSTAADVRCTHCGPGTRAVTRQARRASEIDVDALTALVDEALATHELRSAEPHPLLRRATPFGGPTPSDRLREERHLSRQLELERERAANVAWTRLGRILR